MAKKKHLAPRTIAKAGERVISFSPGRRRFFRHVALLLASPIATSIVAACTPGGEDAPRGESDLPGFFSKHEADTLSAVSRKLFPHAELPADPYTQVAIALDNLAASNADVGALLRFSVRELDQLTGGEWLSAPPREQRAALDQWLNDEHFGLVLNTSIDTLYRNPDVWQAVGYEGSSLEHGGYIQRGFDDIDWLDETQSERDR